MEVTPSSTGRLAVRAAAAVALLTGLGVTGGACTSLPEQQILPDGAAMGGISGATGGFPGVWDAGVDGVIPVPDSAAGGMGAGGTSTGGMPAGGAGGMGMGGMGTGGMPAGGAGGMGMGGMGMGGMGTGGMTGECMNNARRCVGGTQPQRCVGGRWENTTPITRNLVINPGFDLGERPWILGGPEPNNVIGPRGAGFFHSSPNSAWLGGANGYVETLDQFINVPNNTLGISVYFRARIDTTETDARDYDYLELFWGSESLGFLGNTDATNGGFTRWQPDNPTGNYSGTNQRLRFQSRLDSSNPTSFYIDDVEVNATVCE